MHYSPAESGLLNQHLPGCGPHCDRHGYLALHAFDNTNGNISGYAFANTSTSPVTPTLTFYSESGTELAPYSIPQLSAFGHTEFLLNAAGLPPTLANAKGIMTISSSSVYPLGFRFALSGSSIESFSTWLP